MIDTFRTHARTLTSPPEHAGAIVPDDGGTLGHAARAVYVGTAGDLAVRMLGGAEVTLASVPAGALLPIRVDRVRATGTTAGQILGFW